ncbi:MAG: 2-dehydropantoate 2-reductase [Gammaproteobacteria bacterium]
MRVAVVGVGGVGAYFGARLAAAGTDVVFVARGAHLDAIRARGLRVDSVLGDMLIRPAHASDDPGAFGPVDYVLLGVKTWQVADLAPRLEPLLKPTTLIVPLQNGVETPDELGRLLGAQHTSGGMCAGFCLIEAPGHVRHLGGVTFLRFGELSDERTPRVLALRDAFVQAGVDAAVPDDIRATLWEKLLLVVPFGSLGAVSRAPIGVLMKTPETRAFMIAGMREIEAVARANGVRLPDGAVDRALALLDKATPEGTSSMQRDIAARKRSELDAWTGAVVRLGALHYVPTPLHSFLYTCLLPLERRARGEIAFA